LNSLRALTVVALIAVCSVAGCHSTEETLKPEPSASPVPTASPVPPSSPAASGPQGVGLPLTVNVVLTNGGCAPDRSSVPAGAIVFSVVNNGGDAVSELELMHSDTILGERENLAPGLSGTFLVKLQPGTYVLACPGATTAQTTFTVTDAGGASTSP
jgi:Cupredoxin-like domain